MARQSPNFSAYVPPEVIARFRQGRDARQLSTAAYLAKLLDLHEACRQWRSEWDYREDRDDMSLMLAIDDLGLGPITA